MRDTGCRPPGWTAGGAKRSARYLIPVRFFGRSGRLDRSRSSGCYLIDREHCSVVERTEDQAFRPIRMQSDRQEYRSIQLNLDVVVEGTTRSSRRRVGHCFTAALSEYRPVPFRELMGNGDTGYNPLRQPKELRELQTVDDECRVLRALIATDQETVTPILSHRREIERLQNGDTAVLTYTLLPKINCALDVASLIRPVIVNSSRHVRGVSRLSFQHCHAP